VIGDSVENRNNVRMPELKKLVRPVAETGCEIRIVPRVGMD
jgi:hypothetical protein